MRPGCCLLATLAALCCVSLAVSCTAKKHHPRTVSPPPRKSSLPQETLILADRAFTVELAYRRATRARGLMFRRELAPDAGMLFIFPRSAPRRFHMDNCLIDLDILFITAQGRIARIATMKAPPPGRPSLVYPCPIPVKYALELPAGTARQLRLRPGQRLNLPPRIRNLNAEPD